MTASNEHEPSWGCYCDDDLLDVCLGDAFSVNWMHFAEKVSVIYGPLLENIAMVMRA